jgi:putative ABC transport system ATP-binding protein
MLESSPNRISLNSVSQSFFASKCNVNLFQDLTLSIVQGKSYAITGPSGSGKSSLLMLMSGLEKPTGGQISYLVNKQVRPFSELREDIGFIFQQFHLLPELNALNNVALPLKLRGHKHAQVKAKIYLEKVGLGHRLQHKPQQLSGGEQQRVAIARALVFEPKFILADEPTGNLDTQNAAEVADLLFACCQEKGAGLIVVTHSDQLAARAQHVFSFKNEADGLTELTKRMET